MIVVCGRGIDKGGLSAMRRLLSSIHLTIRQGSGLELVALGLILSISILMAQRTAVGQGSPTGQNSPGDHLEPGL